ncbi:hypothetical protein MUN84_00980 [Hymenobacter sp. 5516J-16]|uniref:hypothetical protein n=1 Tax=Hymenobacter sp. 5516J-16 TaxID=2932253 RepID=UPI001FCFEF01|nr:hypothetical protein [Hymenobacter sp. 5516J-16]UOQ77333.1 hypothetical protein MUN84_00980 [Hymenobacter sp. 5516J-16]
MGQTSRKKPKQPTATLNGGYKDVVALDSTLWAVDASGHLASFTSAGEERPLSTTLKVPITSIHATGKDELLVVCGQDIYLLNSKTQACTYEAKLPPKTVFIARDNRKQIWAATETGLLNVATNQSFVPDSTLNHYYKWRPQPSAALLDSYNILWIGFDMGEWGGNLQVFDTNLQRFVPVDFADTLGRLCPVNSFCEAKTQMYLSGAVAHGSNSSCITRFDKLQAKRVFNSSWRENYRTMVFGDPGGEYISTIAYSPTENRLYYNSQNGIYRAPINMELHQQDAWQLVCAPMSSWPTDRRQHVSKMVFTSDNKLVLLVENNALGIWDGRILTLIP